MPIIYRDPVYDGAADPTVIRRETDGTYFMFYTQRRATLECSGVEWAHGTKIGVAMCDRFGWPFSPGSDESGLNEYVEITEDSVYYPYPGEPEYVCFSNVMFSDKLPHDGYGYRRDKWYYAGTADLPFEEGKTTYWAPEVIFDGENYRMFVTSVDGVYADWSGKAEILQFISPDLVKWTPLGAVPIDSPRVIDACAFPLPSGGWRLWYKDEARGSHTFYIDTFDFTYWIYGGTATSDTPQEGPNVFELGGRYWLVADVWEDRLAVYVSDDLKRFERLKMKMLPANACHPDVYVEKDWAKIVYFTYPNRDRHSVICDDYLEVGEIDGVPWLLT